jgi:hypothetical protein
MDKKIESLVGGDDEALEGNSLCDCDEHSRDTDATDGTQVDLTKYFDWKAELKWIQGHVRRHHPCADQDELVGMCAVAALEALANGYDPKRGPFRYYLQTFVMPKAHEEYLRSVGAGLPM